MVCGVEWMSGLWGWVIFGFEWMSGLWGWVDAWFMGLGV